MTGLDGILCIDKPEGFTSFDVVAKMRGIAKTRKIGHAGTLDPMATGVLPLFLGQATKACDILPRQDKAYIAQFRLGVETDTLDITGQVLAERPVQADEMQVREAAGQFIGQIMQVPPMYSALKVGGRKLCDLAREGRQIERQPRPVTIYSLDFLGRCEEADTYRIAVHCSKGTYIRTLVSDIGQALGCGAVLTALRRTMAAGFEQKSCITLGQAQQLADTGELYRAVMPVEEAFACLPRVCLHGKQVQMYLNGVRLDAARVDCQSRDGMLGVYTEDGGFIGTAVIRDGELRSNKRFMREG